MSRSAACKSLRYKLNILKQFCPVFCRYYAHPRSYISTAYWLSYPTSIQVIQAPQRELINHFPSDCMTNFGHWLRSCVQPVISFAAAPVSGSHRPEGWVTPPGCRWWWLLCQEHHCAAHQGSDSCPWPQEQKREWSELRGGSGSHILSWCRQVLRVCPGREGRSIPGWSESREAAIQPLPQCNKVPGPTSPTGRASGWKADSGEGENWPGWCWGWYTKPRCWARLMRSIWLRLLLSSSEDTSGIHSAGATWPLRSAPRPERCSERGPPVQNMEKWKNEDIK